jgi:hypothetical protein
MSKKNTKIKVPKVKKNQLAPEISYLPYKYAGRQAVELMYNIDPKRKGITWEKIRKIAQDMSQSIFEEDSNTKISVSVLSNVKWVSGRFTDTGEPVEMYESSSISIDGEDPRFAKQSQYHSFRLVVLKKGSKEGGNSSNNDCLFYAIASVLHDLNPFKKPSQLKTYLHLKRNDKIDIELIPRVEDKLKNYKINVSGDHTYISPKDCKLSINLKLVDGHYTVDYSKSNKLIKNASYKELKPIIYDSNIDIEMNAYDGEKLYHLSSEEFIKIKTESKTHIIINKDDGSSLVESYDKFIQDANALKIESDNYINLYKTGNNVSASLDLFERFSRHVEYPESISQLEGTWIDNASYGALIHADINYKGKGHNYDFVSHYPSIMLDSKFMIPVGAGEFKHITQEQFNEYSFIPTGIYRCKILSDIDQKLFRINPRNFYTHIDLTRAIELGYIIQMVQDGQANMLYYERSKTINANLIFGQFIKFMYDLKQKNICDRVKVILNCLWGALCQKRKKTQVARKTDKELIDIPSDCTVLYTIKHNQGETIHFVKNNDMYKYNYARMMPFLLSKGRSKLSKTIEPHTEKVVYVHTDGFISTEQLRIKTGDNLGDLKDKGSSDNIEIVNKNKVVSHD